jgi:hypothetical protein
MTCHFVHALKQLRTSNSTLRSLCQLLSKYQERIRLVDLACGIGRRDCAIKHELLLVLRHASRFLEMCTMLPYPVSNSSLYTQE